MRDSECGLVDEGTACGLQNDDGGPGHSASWQAVLLRARRTPALSGRRLIEEFDLGRQGPLVSKRAEAHNRRVEGWFADTDAFTAGEALWRAVSTPTLKVARPAVGDRVLDACCGTDAFSLPAARAVGRDGRVDGVDLSAGPVGVLQRRAAVEALPQVQAHVGDVMSSGEVDSYDLVACVLGVFFLPDLDAGAARLVELARPGGRVCVTTWAEGALGAFFRHLSAAVAPHAPPASDASAGVSPASGTSAGVSPAQRVASEAGMRSLLVAAGLVEVVVARRRLSVPLTVDLAVALLDGSGAKLVLEPLAGPERAAVRSDLRARVGASATPEALDASVLVGTGRRPGG